MLASNPLLDDEEDDYWNSRWLNEMVCTWSMTIFQRDCFVTMNRNHKPVCQWFDWHGAVTGIAIGEKHRVFKEPSPFI